MRHFLIVLIAACAISACASPAMAQWGRGVGISIGPGGVHISAGRGAVWGGGYVGTHAQRYHGNFGGGYWQGGYVGTHADRYYSRFGGGHYGVRNVPFGGVSYCGVPVSGHHHIPPVMYSPAPTTYYYSW